MTNTTTYTRIVKLVDSYERDLATKNGNARPIAKLAKKIYNAPDGAPESEIFRVLGVIQGLMWALEVRGWGELEMESKALGTAKFKPADRKFRRAA